MNIDKLANREGFVTQTTSDCNLTPNHLRDYAWRCVNYVYNLSNIIKVKVRLNGLIFVTASCRNG